MCEKFNRYKVSLFAIHKYNTRWRFYSNDCGLFNIWFRLLCNQAYSARVELYNSEVILKHKFRKILISKKYSLTVNIHCLSPIIRWSLCLDNLFDCVIKPWHFVTIVSYKKFLLINTKFGTFPVIHDEVSTFLS